MNNHLEKVTIRGFKTIRSLENFEPGPLTALIGPNGAGKSNFISFFRMMSWALADPANLAFFVGERGGASRLLHNGPAQTREMEAELSIRTEAGNNQYAFRLFYAADDTFGLRGGTLQVHPGWPASTRLAGHRRGAQFSWVDTRSGHRHRRRGHPHPPATDHRAPVPQHLGYVADQGQLERLRQQVPQGRRRQRRSGAVQAAGE